MVYSEIDFKKIEKQSKQRILNMFREQNVKYETLVKENEDMNNKLFDIGSREYHRGYCDGMKRVLETVEIIFGRGNEE